MSHHTDLSKLPPPSPGNRPTRGGPSNPPGRKRIVIIGLVAAFVLLAAGVGIGKVLYNTSDDPPMAEATSSTTEHGKESSEEGSSPDEELVNKDAGTNDTGATGTEATGECPDDENEIYRGTTEDFNVRICESAIVTDTYTYVGGNDDLGYVVLTAEENQGSSGTTFLASNGVTDYAVWHEAIAISKDGQELKTQAWKSGNMGNLHPGGASQSGDNTQDSADVPFNPNDIPPCAWGGCPGDH